MFASQACHEFKFVSWTNCPLTVCCLLVERHLLIAGNTAQPPPPRSFTQVIGQHVVSSRVRYNRALIESSLHVSLLSSQNSGPGDDRL
jgi:hypothetical protein